MSSKINRGVKIFNVRFRTTPVDILPPPDNGDEVDFGNEISISEENTRETYNLGTGNDIGAGAVESAGIGIDNTGVIGYYYTGSGDNDIVLSTVEVDSNNNIDVIGSLTIENQRSLNLDSHIIDLFQAPALDATGTANGEAILSHGNGTAPVIRSYVPSPTTQSSTVNGSFAGGGVSRFIKTVVNDFRYNMVAYYTNNALVRMNYGSFTFNSLSSNFGTNYLTANIAAGKGQYAIDYHRLLLGQTGRSWMLLRDSATTTSIRTTVNNAPSDVRTEQINIAGATDYFGDIRALDNSNRAFIALSTDNEPNDIRFYIADENGTALTIVSEGFILQDSSDVYASKSQIKVIPLDGTNLFVIWNSSNENEGIKGIKVTLNDNLDDIEATGSVVDIAPAASSVLYRNMSVFKVPNSDNQIVVSYTKTGDTPAPVFAKAITVN
jgi:hypothetical protein